MPADIGVPLLYGPKCRRLACVWIRLDVDPLPVLNSFTSIVSHWQKSLSTCLTEAKQPIISARRTATILRQTAAIASFSSRLVLLFQPSLRKARLETEIEF